MFYSVTVNHDRHQYMDEKRRLWSAELINWIESLEGKEKI